MSYTNHTTNYNLPQYVGTDKPTYLGDFNTAMGAIDTQMKANADSASTANTTATSASNAIGALTNLTTTDKSNLVAAVNEVQSETNTAQTTANNAATQAATNTSAISSLSSYLDLSNFTNPTINVTGGSLHPTSSINCASNADGSLGKVYGWMNITATGSTVRISFATPLRPSQAITINGVVISQIDNGTSWATTQRSLTIGTDGTASISISDTTNGVVWRLNVVAALIFAKSFGDTIIPD